MGSIARDVHLLEGAKPGIPKLVTHRVHSENASFIIKVIYRLQKACQFLSIFYVAITSRDLISPFFCLRKIKRN